MIAVMMASRSVSAVSVWVTVIAMTGLGLGPLLSWALGNEKTHRLLKGLAIAAGLAVLATYVFVGGGCDWWVPDWLCYSVI